MNIIANTTENFTKQDGNYRYTYWGKHFFECDRKMSEQRNISLQDLSNLFNDVENELRTQMKRLNIPLQ